MTPDDAAAQAVRAVPGDGSTPHACRLAIAHVLALEDGPDRDRWRSNLAACEAALLDGRSPPRPGMTDVDVSSAILAAESEAGMMRPPVRVPRIDALDARDNGRA